MSERLVDARGLKCPLPVLKTEKILAEAPVGAKIVILATDPVAKLDIALFCQQKGYALAASQEDGVLRFEIVKRTDQDPGIG